ncbi:MAG: uroporphyrinogen decarboxylase family protein [Anaeromyxobacteraceae bacterium]
MSGPTSAQRLLAAFEGRLLDRVPYVIPATMHGARLLQMPLQAYFGDARAMVEGQLRLRALLGHDLLQAYPYVSVEHEAFGGETVFQPDGPPVPGPPTLRLSRLGALEAPDPAAVPALRRVLEATRALVARANGECLIMGAIMSPYSLPPMQLGLHVWLELLHEAPAEADRLLAVNERFAVAWALMQRAAGAAGITVVDPVGATEISSPALQQRFALPSLRRTLAAIGAPAGVSHSSARALARVEDVLEAGAAAVVASAGEPLEAFRERTRGRAVLLGGLDSLAIHAGDGEAAARAVRAAVAAAAPGGGFVLTEHHGEIPYPVPLDTLLAITEAAQRFGRQPLTWTGAVA